MKIVLFSHPPFLSSQSMPRFANMILDGMKERGAIIEVWTPRPFFYNLRTPSFLKKWLGYIDQFIIFPIEVKRKLKLCNYDTLFVFADNALGPWVPLVADRPHVIHCHDFLAQKSALNLIQENPTSITGKIYQYYIRRGYQRGRFFISVSEKTRQDLHSFLRNKPLFSEVVYNGLNRMFSLISVSESRSYISNIIKRPLPLGYILHVGGNQWYKNRIGIVDAYSYWRKNTTHKLPLILIGSSPGKELQLVIDQSDYCSDIHCLERADDVIVNNAYCGATFLFFPSLDEGFGWPIAEALASCCKVLTTNIAPLNEVGADIAFYVSRKPYKAELLASWHKEVAIVIDSIIDLEEDSGKNQILLNKGYTSSTNRFNVSTSLDSIYDIYIKVLDKHKYAL